MSMWISQIRKVLGQREQTHIYLVSQKINRIDVAFRDLMHELVLCTKHQTNELIETPVRVDGKLIIKLLPKTYFFQTYFRGDYAIEKYTRHVFDKIKSYDLKTYFVGNYFYQFYDSYEIFGETDYI